MLDAFNLWGVTREEDEEKGYMEACKYRWTSNLIRVKVREASWTLNYKSSNFIKSSVEDRVLIIFNSCENSFV